MRRTPVFLATTHIVRHSPLTLWHLLSLDAPTVATLWTWFIARCCGVTLPIAAPAAMFLAVWILYAADRLLDARSADPTTLEERHHFHERHRRFFIAFIAIAAIALAALVPELLPKALRIYALLAALLAAWFLMIHTRLAHERRLPKELAVGLFFSAATFIPTIARRPDLRISLLLPAALFAAVCALNCMYLYAWEHPGPRPNANWTTLIALKYAGAFVCLILIASLGIAALEYRLPINALCITNACTASTLLLLILNNNRTKLSALTLRAAADLALLTPLLFVAFL